MKRWSAVFKVNSPTKPSYREGIIIAMPPTRFHRSSIHSTPNWKRKKKERPGIKINSVPAFPTLACEWSLCSRLRIRVFFSHGRSLASGGWRLVILVSCFPTLSLVSWHLELVLCCTISPYHLIPDKSKSCYVCLYDNHAGSIK